MCDVINRQLLIDALPVVSQMVYLTLLLATRALVVNFSNEVPRYPWKKENDKNKKLFTIIIHMLYVAAIFDGVLWDNKIYIES